MWRHKDKQDVSPELRLILAYLLSCPETNRIGCFQVSPIQICENTGLSQYQVEVSLVELQKRDLARFDNDHHWVWLPEVLQQNPFNDSQDVRNSLPELAAVPRDLSFRHELVQAFRASADRPGADQTQTAKNLQTINNLGDDNKAVDEVVGMYYAVRKQLPGLPNFDYAALRSMVRSGMRVRQYLKRWRQFLVEQMQSTTLRALGLITIFSAIAFVVFPAIDLGTARLFFEPPRNFSLGASLVGRFFDNEVHYAMEYFLVAFVLTFLIGVVRGQPFFGLTTKKFAYVALAIGLGAGLLTNVILKDSWGRARPSQIVEFGGNKQFTPPFMRANQCDKNCSFVSGDAALATCFTAFAVIAERNRRRWWVGLGSFAILVGVMRMARGSHFLSDVVFAILFNLMIVLVLARVLLRDGWRNWPRWTEPD